MYVMITNRCNMRCRHCCYSCTAKGTDMTRRTFLAACELTKDLGSSVFIGGGEPTLHPLLFDFIGLAMCYSELDDISVGIITNGKLTEPALALAKMARLGLITAELSLDEFHDPIDPRVAKAFEKYPKTHVFNNRDSRGIRRAERPFVKLHGRAKKNQYKLGLGEAEAMTGNCVCTDLLVEPNGVIWHCGCRTISYGTVFMPKIPDNYNHECYKQKDTENGER